MKWFLTLIILALSAGAIELDENLTTHSLYGSNYLLVYGASSTPETGVVGTNGTLWMFRPLTVNSKLYATTMRSLFWNQTLTINENDTAVYKTVNRINFAGLGDAIQRDPVYETVPVMPILENMPNNISDLNVTGTVTLPNGTHYYNNIVLEDNSSIVLDSGELHCNSLVFNNNTSILSDTGSLQIVIHEHNNNLNFWLSLVGIDIDVVVSSNTTIIGTIIAPNSEIILQDDVNIVGQIFAKGVTLQDFAGEVFEFINIKQPYVLDALYNCNEHETITADVIIIRN